ncbi:glutaredoxin [uncultured Marinobacter sp.]|uniref:glutaredoxin family protein n=1 Tax=uncultured Marinobacter sp. TaxID=187379 RepID=UPI002596F11D|nr:glutaredoxin [uncultured Marinobacter sp.]
MIYPDGHRRYRVVDDSDNKEEVLDSFSILLQAEIALTRALNNNVDAYLMDAKEMNLDSFTVYTQPGCFFCTKAIELLKNHDQAVNVIDINTDPEARKLMVKNDFKTVPQVYHNGNHVGGYEALVQYMETANAQ